MDETLFHKFTQHNNLQAELLGTGDAELVEVIAVFPSCAKFYLKFYTGFQQGWVLGSRSRWKRSQRTWEMPGEAENQAPW